MIPMIPAHNTNMYKGRVRPISRIGLHTTQTGPDTARGVANFFAKPHRPKSSAHVTVGAHSAYQSVLARDTAFAMPKVNADGYHIELCGFAQWTSDDWLREDGRGRHVFLWGSCIAAQAVNLFRFLSAPFQVRELLPSELRNGSGYGFVRHSTASLVLGGTHTDPGEDFPLSEFFDAVEWWLDQGPGNGIQW